MARAISRRRLIRISGAAAGLALGVPVRASTSEADLTVWHGTLLGAVATMTIHHRDRDQAERLISMACAEARRLEHQFSLYIEDSDLVRLNRSGILVNPAPEFVELLQASLWYAELTGGMFDPTVQPLWELYANHFTKVDPDPAGPDQSSVEAALARVGYHRLLVSRDLIVAPKGVALTLNGIAQGYITDRVVNLLRSQGIAHSLVDMGEIRAIGARPDGRPWGVGIADPASSAGIQSELPIVDRAVSTSGAYGFQFDPAGCFNHLFNPVLGTCGHLYRSVTTIAETATAADALSTAFSLMDQLRIRTLMSRAGIERTRLIDAAGLAVDILA
jgi:thiamine biosynthesis lipoprotein